MGGRTTPQSAILPPLVQSECPRKETEGPGAVYGASFFRNRCFTGWTGHCRRAGGGGGTGNKDRSWQTETAAQSQRRRKEEAGEGRDNEAGREQSGNRPRGGRTRQNWEHGCYWFHNPGSHNQVKNDHLRKDHLLFSHHKEGSSCEDQERSSRLSYRVTSASWWRRRKAVSIIRVCRVHLQVQGVWINEKRAETEYDLWLINMFS